MSIEENKSLGIELPEPKDLLDLIATKIINKIIYVSGQISVNEKGMLIKVKWTGIRYKPRL